MVKINNCLFVTNRLDQFSITSLSYNKEIMRREIDEINKFKYTDKDIINPIKDREQ